MNTADLSATDAPEAPKTLVGPKTRAVRAWMLVPPVDALMLVLPAIWAPQSAKALGATAILTVLLLTNGRGYRARLHLSVLDELPLLLTRLCTAIAIVATITALRHELEGVTAYLVASLSAVGLFIFGRILTTQIILWARRHQIVSHRTLIVGGGTVATELAVLLSRYRRYGLKVEGYVDDAREETMAGAPWLGPVRHIDLIVQERRINAILVADGSFDEEALIEIVRSPTVQSTELLVVPRLRHLNTQVSQPDHIGSIPVMRISRPALEGVAWALKRGFDVVLSAAAIIALSPLWLACALAVRLETGPGVLFRQERVGRYGEIFECLKFRTMKPANPTESATQWSIANDRRIGRVGRFLRMTSLDELPQLWNILRGDMTLVGPRPERPYFVDKFSAEIPRYQHRHRVPVGLTGLAQVSGLRGDTPIIDRARFDNYYIESWTLWLDAKVIIRTFGEVLLGRGR